MTVNLSIKNVPGELAERLRERAAKAHRSLQGELLAILEEAASPRRRRSASDVLARVRALGVATPSEAAREIRKERRARSRRRRLGAGGVALR